MRFNKIDVASLCHSITTPLMAPVLRLVYESYIPGPTRPETEQPADEFVYEMDEIPQRLNCHKPWPSYGNFSDSSIGTIL
jgi:hypothetical protein